MKLYVVLTLALALSGVARASNNIDAWISERQAAGELAAAAVAVIERGEVETRGHGHRDGTDAAAPDAATQFQIGSITKVFTDLLLAEMVAADKVTYATTIGALLPKTLALRNPAVAKITLEALATHRSGLPRLPSNLDLGETRDPYAEFGVDDLHAAVAAARDRQPLGRFYTYSNFGVGLLGQLLAEVDGRGYRSALQHRVLAPLHLPHAAFKPGANAATAISGGKPVHAWRFDALAGAGALWASVDDLARLLQVYLGKQTHGLQHKLADDLEVVAPAGGFEVSRVWHVARAGTQPVYWHNGGTAGFHSFAGFRPDTKRGIAILVSGDADPTEIGLRWLNATASNAQMPKIESALFGQYALTPQFGIGIHESHGTLVAQATGQPAFALHAVGDDWYAFGDVDASVHFVRDDGKVAALELAQNGQLQRAPRAAEVATAAARRRIEIDSAQLDAYVGEYTFAPGAVLSVKRSAQGLKAQLTGQPYFPIYPGAVDRFFYEVVDAELQFERDPNGKPGAVVLHQGGAAQRAQRTR